MKQKILIGRRKIQKISKAHYINLPKVWMNNNLAKQGDSVQVRLEIDGSLNISVAPATPCQEKAEAASHKPLKESVSA